MIELVSEQGELPLRPPELLLGDWFAFTDRHIYHPVRPTEVVTDRFLLRERGRSDDLEWEKDEWSVGALLVPIGGVPQAEAETRLARVRDTIWAHNAELRPGWLEGTTFDFAETSVIGEVQVWPWVRTWRHSRTDATVVEPRPDFIIYHQLEPRTTEGGKEYVHPLDGLAVLRAAVERIAYYSPTARVSVLRDHLRDYLAARRAALLVSVVADRFANAVLDSALQLAAREQEQLAGMPSNERAWVTTTLHPSDSTVHGFARGRASLYWNIVIPPYPSPRVSRCPWPHPSIGEVPVEDNAPRFIADGEGGRCLAEDQKAPLYLYFRPDVLAKYLQTPGYRVHFHMRHWGQACGPGNSCVDVGINRRGLLTAFRPDIAKLPADEQLHWAHHSSLPDGEICDELFETRMQQNPPRAPSVPELLTSARVSLAEAVARRFGTTLYAAPDEYPRARDVDALSVGPVRDDFREVVDLAKPLYGWVVESMSTQALREALDRAGTTIEPEWKQIKLLQVILMAVSRMPESEARQAVVSLVALNDLRVAAAHALDDRLEDAYHRLGQQRVPPTPRAAWDVLVDAVVTGVQGLAATMGRPTARQ